MINDAVITALRTALLGLVALGLFGATSLLATHLHTGETCPIIATIPACLFAVIGYALLLISIIVTKGRPLFWLGAVPILGLAMFGVGLEILRGGGVCPVGPRGVPQCVISLGIILMVIALHLWVSSKRRLN